MTSRALRAALLLASLFVWATFVVVALRRMPNAIENGNLEGALMDQVARIARGQPLYVAPSLGFTPFAYMPLYFTITGLLARILGVDFWVGRLVSTLAATGLAALMFGIVKRETGSRLLGLASGAIFLWGQGVLAGGYDLVRSDPLMLCFAFSGLATLRFGRGRWSAVAAGLLVAAAFFTKQHGLLFGLAVLPWLWRCDRPRLLPFALSLALGAGLTFALLRLWLGPWFVFYVYDVPSHWSQFGRVRTLDFVRLRLLGQFSPLTLAMILGPARRARPWDEPVSFWWWAALGGIGCGALAMLDPYAYFHVLMPVLAGLAVVGPIAVHRLLLDDPGLPAGRGWSLASAVLLCEFVLLLYHPTMGHLPHGDGRAARAEWVRRLHAAPGGVLMPYHGFYTSLAGKGESIGLLPIDDILRSKGNSLLARDPGAIERLFDPLRRGPGRPWIVTDVPLDSIRERSGPLWASVRPGYRLAQVLPDSAPSLRALEGFASTPRFVYVPVEPDSADAAAPRR